MVRYIIILLTFISLISQSQVREIEYRNPSFFSYWLRTDTFKVGDSTATAIYSGTLVDEDYVTSEINSISIPSGLGDSLVRAFNGAILENHTIDVSSDGVNVQLKLTSTVDSVSLFFDGATFKFNVPDSINLTAGSDAIPTRNYVYIPKSTKVLTVSTANFPTSEQYIPIADLVVQTASSAQTDGVYKAHAWTDHLENSVGQGHIAHINEWIRAQNASWISGVVPSVTVGTDAGGKDSLKWSNTSGQVRQLHPHAFPVFNFSAGSDHAYVINDQATSYDRITDLNEIITDTEGGSLTGNNTYYSLVVWGVVSEESDDCQIMVNKPSGSYGSSDDALNDVSKYDIFTIPSNFTGTGFLIARVTLRYQTASSGTFTVEQVEDLRGLFPSTGAGGGSSPSSTGSFADNAFEVFNITDNTKLLNFDVSNVTTGTTRTLTIPDKNDTIATLSDVVKSSGITTIPGTNSWELIGGISGSSRFRIQYDDEEIEMRHGTADRILMTGSGIDFYDDNVRILKLRDDTGVGSEVSTFRGGLNLLEEATNPASPGSSGYLWNVLGDPIWYDGTSYINLSSGGSLNFTNGLSQSGNNVTWGDLTSSTTIDGFDNGGLTFSLGASSGLFVEDGYFELLLQRPGDTWKKFILDGKFFDPIELFNRGTAGNDYTKFLMDTIDYKFIVYDGSESTIMQITGDTIFNNVPVKAQKLTDGSVTDSVKNIIKPPYYFSEFKDSAVNISLTAATWDLITNSTDSLFGIKLNNGFSWDSDTIIANVAGVYKIYCSLTFNNLGNGSQWQFRINSGDGELAFVMQTGRSTSDPFTVPISALWEASSGERLWYEMKQDVGTDPENLKAGQIVINYLSP